MSVLLITAGERRHRYFVQRAAARLDVCGVVCETKAAAVPAQQSLLAEDADVIHRHFAERDAVEQRLLGDPDAIDDRLVLQIPTGSVNDESTCRWMESRKPELVLLYGTGLLKAPVLDLFAGRIVNLHLGLSPYYRGAGTNFWPLVNGEPECAGSTVHLAVSKVDAGPIYAQVRPDFESGDRAHEIGTKAMMAGVSALLDVAEAFGAGLAGHTQDLSVGRVCRQKDFNAAAVRQLWRNLDEGMVSEYLACRVRRDSRFPIQTLMPNAASAGAA